MTNPDLPSSAKEMIAEARELGHVPENEINLAWNEMMMNFEEDNKKKFYRNSKRVQALARVLTGSHNKFLRIKEWLKKARLLVYNDEKKIASMFIERTKKLLEETGRELAPVIK